MPQQDFDALLADFDWLVVRGEDHLFARSGLASQCCGTSIRPTTTPMWPSSDAWLDVYCSGLPTLAAATYRAASHAFVVGEQTQPSRTIGHLLPVLREHAVTWRNQLLHKPTREPSR